MIIKDSMKQIGDRLDVIEKLKVKAYEADSIEVPCGLVGLPGNINYQTTYGPGFCSMRLEVTILVSMVDDRIRLDDIAQYGDTLGTKSIRHILETGVYTAFDSLTVLSGRFQVVRISDIDYLAFIVLVDIIGQNN